MKTVKIQVELTIPSALASRIKSEDVSIIRNGKYRVVKIGDRVIKNPEKVEITIEDTRRSHGRSKG